eukprot:scaffold73450_cov20-Tisochrysis_lutea.AAC.5
MSARLPPQPWHSSRGSGFPNGAPNYALQNPQKTTWLLDCAMHYKMTCIQMTAQSRAACGNDVAAGLCHARELAELLRSHDLMSHTNVIPWNPVDESEFARPSRNQ